MIKEYVILLPLQNQNYQPRAPYFLPIKKIFEQRWNPVTRKFIWELYVSFPTQLKPEEFAREARMRSNASTEVWLGPKSICLTTNARVSLGEARAICGDERRLIYKLGRCVSSPSLLSPKGRKIKQHQVNFEECAVTLELGKRNEKENRMGHVFFLNIPC